MGAAGAVTQGFSMVLNAAAGGEEMEAESQKNAYAQNAAKQNAYIANIAARNALAAGSVADEQSRLRYGAIEGQQRTAYGASGVTATAGSPISALADTGAMSDYDSAIIRDKAAKEAWGYEAQGQQYTQQQSLLKAQEGYAQLAGGMKIAGGIIGGAGSIAGSSGGMSGSGGGG